MKSVHFGNRDYWKLVFDDNDNISDGKVINGELRSGFFLASTPMYIPTSRLAQFAEELLQLDRTLEGTARLENKNDQSEIVWLLESTRHGHIKSTGTYCINQNVLNFHFMTDQTQLKPLLNWLDSLLKQHKSGDSKSTTASA